jgi:hypothetical protein
LQADKGYRVSELPTVRTIRNKLNKLGIFPQRVKKCEPIRKIPETDAIFIQVKTINSNTDNAHNALRISLDCKAVVKIGPFSRGGKTESNKKHRITILNPIRPLFRLGLSYRNFAKVIFGFQSDR